MSEVFNAYMDSLGKVISNPSSLAMAFHSREIIDLSEQIAITDPGDARITQDRTNYMLNTVARRISVHPEKLETVVRVLYNHQSTRVLATRMARDG